MDGLGFQNRIDSYYSTNLREWINGTAFEIKNATEVGFSGIANNAVTRLDTPKGEPPAYGERARPLLLSFSGLSFTPTAVFQ